MSETLTPQFTIKRLTPAYAPPYRRLMLAAYEAHPEAFTSSRTERAELPISWWQARLSGVPQAKDVVFGAVNESSRGEGPDKYDLQGIVGLSFKTGEKTAHKVSVMGMYVSPLIRHQGLGKQLLVAAMAHARQRSGVNLIQLTVTEGNDTARRLYEEHGFKVFGLEPRAVAVGNHYVNKIHMWCQL